MSDLHPETNVAHSLLRDGYSALAVQEAAQRFINRVQETVERRDLDGENLINHVFSERSPMLAFSERQTLREQDEHRGYFRLAAGLVIHVRNALAHEAGVAMDPTEAMEWLGFISVVHRRLDSATPVTSADRDA